MDADEQLARSLQAEEAAASQQKPGTAVLMDLLQHGIQKALSVEDPAAQSAALALMPLQQLRQEAEATAALNRLLLGEDGAASAGGAAAAGGSSMTIEPNDLLVQGLLKWFKRDFFSWVDQPHCDVCRGPTMNVGIAQPTPQEATHKATMVEVYRCSVCESVTRFPRYTDVNKLLQTRRGRCGEWAHTFLLCLRAAGYDARHVTDNADHVWCEYYSEALSRWVHVDPCEEAWDTPLLYEGGWGKQLGYVFGASRHGVVDVARRYVLSPAGLPPRRRLAPEDWLSATISKLSAPLRAGLDLDSRRRLGLRDAAELLQLMALEDAGGSSSGSSNQQGAAANLPGRQSGSQAWRAARQETGGSGSRSSSSIPAAGTPYRAVPDGELPPLFASAGRITGGVARASGEKPAMNPSQVVGRLFDGALDSKWLDFGGGGVGGTAWAEYRLPPSSAAVVVTHYDLIAAEDCPERDPCDWVLEAVPAAPAAEHGGGASHALSSDGWAVLDRRSQQHFKQRHQLRSFGVGKLVASRQWRLRITATANPAAANSVQLACWNLYSGMAAADRQQQQQQEPPAAMPPAGAVVAAAAAAALPRGATDATDATLKYMSTGMCHQLTKLVTAAGESTAADAADGVAAGVSTLALVLNNMHQHPDDPKFWKLSAAAGKLQPVLQHPLLLAALLSAGFRPVIIASDDGRAAAAASQQLKLIADSEESFLAVKSLLRLFG